MISEGRNINVTLIFSPRSLRRGDGGLHQPASRRTPPTPAPTCRRWPASAASSSRASTPRSTVGSRRSAPTEALALRGKAAVAQAKLAYKLFAETFSGARWEALAARGARVQRPLWASTRTKNKAYSDVLYVDELIGPDTVNTLHRSDDRGVRRPRHAAAHGRRRRRRGRAPSGPSSAEVGVDMDDVSARPRARGCRRLHRRASTS